jgi:hypothetical protein
MSCAKTNKEELGRRNQTIGHVVTGGGVEAKGGWRLVFSVMGGEAVGRGGQRCLRERRHAKQKISMEGK